MRPTRLVAGVVLTTAFALVALPGLSSSRTPRSVAPTDMAGLQSVTISERGATAAGIEELDPGHRSAGFLAPDDLVLDPARVGRPAPVRPDVEQPASSAVSIERPPRYTLTGIATFYDHGTTAMRLPRGTRVVICGAAGCIERRITDYGPNAAMYPERIVDLYRPDFFRICGCGWWAGTTSVTVHVY